MHEPERSRGPQRAIVSVALIGFTLGLAAAAWASVETDAGGTHAGLFGKPALDLHMGAEGSVHSFIGRRNLAPGDASAGSLRLHSDGAIPTGVADLDFDARGHLRGPQGGPRLDDVLFVTSLFYGADDLLDGRDGGRDLLAEIDRHPLHGNADGRISIRELDAGANDLPPPRTDAEGGTAFNLEVRYEPPGADGSDYAGQEFLLTFVFHLADVLDGDLN